MTGLLGWLFGGSSSDAARADWERRKRIHDKCVDDAARAADSYSRAKTDAEKQAVIDRIRAIRRELKDV